MRNISIYCRQIRQVLSWLVYICYAITMVLIVKQYYAVGIAASVFRFVAWQLVLAATIAARQK